MWIDFLILLLIIILSWILTYYHKKHKGIAIFFAFLGIVSPLLGVLQYFTDYNPLTGIKESIESAFSESHDNVEPEETAKNEVKSEENADTSNTSATDVPAIQVSIPDKTESPAQSKEIPDTIDIPYSNQSDTVAFLNVWEKMYRDSNGIIHIAWTPLSGQNTYKINIEIDDPFLNADTSREYFCEDSSYDIDLSECSPKTVIFLSVGVYDDELSDWTYTKTSFVLLD